MQKNYPHKLIRIVTQFINIYYIFGGLLLLIGVPMAWSYSYASSVGERIFNVAGLAFMLFLALLFIAVGIRSTKKQ